MFSMDTFKYLGQVAITAVVAVPLGLAIAYGLNWNAERKYQANRKSAETTQMTTATGYQPPAYPEMVVESLTIRPEVNQYLNTEYGSAPSPSVSNFVSMIRGTPL